MSNIANNIVAHDKMLSDIFTNNRYHIDVFQRDYRWQYKHVDALISDLVSNFLSCYTNGDSIENVADYDCYYMGPIVVCTDKGSLSVVDGQQRLTTFSLLFIYLEHLQVLLDIPDEKRIDWNKYLYITKGGRKSFTLDIPARQSMMDYLVQYGTQIPAELIQDDMEMEDKESVLNLKERYDDIYQLFPPDIKKVEIFPLFVEWLLYKVIMVEIQAYSNDNAYTIFETMNDRGMNLNQTEILKGYILSRINDESRQEEMNEFWRNRVADVKRMAENEEADLAFFRAWLRAKYAQSIRQGHSGSAVEDFEQIGSHFTNWFKTKRKDIGLKSSDDYYYFIRGDFDFYSNVYMSLMRMQKEERCIDNNPYYVTACYPMADSLYMPLMLASVLPRDLRSEVQMKLGLVNRYVDVYINRRTLSNRSVNQTAIRRKVFEMIKKIRNVDLVTLQHVLADEIKKMADDPGQIPANYGFSQNYMHYLLARFLHYMEPNQEFASFLRTRKRNSMVLCQIFTESEWQELQLNESGCSCWSLMNYCLCQRQYSDLKQIPVKDRLNWLTDNGYMPEMVGINSLTKVEFIKCRYHIFEGFVDSIWKIPN